ncbi:MAG: hypothetical protein LW859_01380, partial [Anabaena sp. 49633_E8]|nr:hypothetical protein [Anabaena sp. 49633_E8]
PRCYDLDNVYSCFEWFGSHKLQITPFIYALVNREQETGNREQGTEYKFIYFLLPSFFFLLSSFFFLLIAKRGVSHTPDSEAWR